MQFSEALGVQRGEVVAFVGAGGKTSAMTQLYQELTGRKWRVLITTTTRIAEDELTAFPYALPLERYQSPRYLSHLLSQHGGVFLYKRLWGGKAIGLAPDFITNLLDQLDSDCLLIEADGSRRFGLKAPQAHEPVIPSETTLVVPVVNFNLVGQPFTRENVYNIEAIQERYGFPYGAPIQAPWVAQILRDEAFGLKGVPPQARVIPLLNQVKDSLSERLKARRTASLILQEARVQGVAIGAAQTKDSPVYEIQRRIGAIVLAGGLSRRMGHPKPLLAWGEQTIIETIIQRILPLRLADLVVVTGHHASQVQSVLQKTGIRSVYNPNYATGEMLSSLQVGIKALDPSLSACLVFLGDQPQINVRVVYNILLAYALGQGTIVAPSYMKRRGHPILIDRRYWRELLDLPQGAAPRDVINAYRQETAYVVTDDANVLRDMDTPEEYQEALRRAGLI